METLKGSPRLMRVLIAILLLVLSAQTSAAVINAGHGLPHTKAAYTTLQGHVTAMGNLRFWGSKSEYSNEAGDVVAKIWVARALANVTYGFDKHGEVSLTPILYQDAHKEEGEQSLWDTFLHFKMGNFKIENQPVWLGFELGTRFPSGKKHNVIFEDYTAGKFEFGVMELFTYRYVAPQLKNDFRVHANLGYWNHNDKNVTLTEVEPPELGFVDQMSQSIRYAAGVEFPTKNIVYGLELYGLSWLVRPPVGAASRDNYLYMNVSGVYKPHHRIFVVANADLRLSAGANTTEGFMPELPGLASYPGWRINLGIKYQILPQSDYELMRPVIERQQSRKTRELYSQLKNEMEKREKSRAELERLKKEKEQQDKQTNSLETQNN